MLGLAGVVLYVFAVSTNFLNLFGRMPNLKSLENPRSELASEIYSADNVLMGKYFRENRTPAEYEDLPQHLVDALIATEDARFEEHSGIDPKATGRVAAGLLTGGSGGGGSTLTQQLAKVLFRTRDDLNDGALNDVPGVRMLITKTKEWILAIRLERSYTKREILRMYLNTNDYGSNAFRYQYGGQNVFRQEADGPDPPRGRYAGGRAQRALRASAPSSTRPARGPAATGCCAR